MYPRLEINLSKLEHNTRLIRQMCERHNVKIWGVTKCFCAIPKAAMAMLLGGADMLADSRIENLKKLKDIPCKKVLLRIPMHCEVDDVVLYSDYSQNSELSTLKLLGEAAQKMGKIHNVIIMLDLGDLREGVWPNNIDEFVGEAVKIKGIKIKGFGVNLTCYGGVIPDETNLSKLVDISKDMGDKYNLDIEIISGGNSSSLYLVEKGTLPKGINNLRVGEAILLGRETAFGKRLDGLYDDVFVLKGQIVELKEKPSVPIGNIGMDAFGGKPVFEDKGIMKRAIIAMGRQDIDINLIRPFDENIKLLGASSDHTILDVTNSNREYKVGDVVEFYLDYGGLLKAATSEYVHKVLI
ncbi:MAG: ornithine racemase Orr [Caloramator sp.]|nr:ornithine racemase Orr [Caloramator sp.]